MTDISQLLAQASVLSDAPTTNMEGTNHGHAKGQAVGGNRPAGDELALYDVAVRRLAKCPEHKLGEFEEWLRGELDQRRLRVTPIGVKPDQEARLLIGRWVDDAGVDAAMSRHRVSRATAYRYWREWRTYRAKEEA